MIFKYRKFVINKEFVKEEIKDIQYVSLEPQEIKISSYAIKYGRSCVRTGE